LFPMTTPRKMMIKTFKLILHVIVVRLLILFFNGADTIY